MLFSYIPSLFYALYGCVVLDQFYFPLRGWRTPWKSPTWASFILWPVAGELGAQRVGMLVEKGLGSHGFEPFSFSLVGFLNSPAWSRETRNTMGSGENCCVGRNG